MKNATVTIEQNKSKDEKFKTFCATCKSETNHLVAQSVDVIGSEIIRYGKNSNDQDSVDWSDCYQIIQCMGCDAFSFHHKNWFSEAQDYYGPDDYNDGTTSWLYPQRGKDDFTAKDFYNVPKNLRAIYRCRVPDDCIDPRRYPLFMARDVMRSLIEQLETRKRSAP